MSITQCCIGKVRVSANLSFLGGIALHILHNIDRLGLNIFICSVLDLSFNSVKNNLCF